MIRRAVLVLLVSLACACSQPPDYAATVRDLQKYKNEADLESAVGLFADEPSLHFGGMGTITGLAEIRGILEYDLALNTHLQFYDCETKGQEVSCSVSETNDWLKIAGIDSIEYDENRFTFSTDGRIASVVATLSDTSGQRLGAAMAEFHAWGTTNEPAEYGSLFSEEGNFVYSGENAEKVVALLRMWRSNVPTGPRNTSKTH
jgi:hypothetical protein